MLELPRIEVNRVDDYTGLSYGLEEFKSDSGLSTRVARSCVGHGWSFALTYEGLKPDDAGQIIQWFNAIQVDYNTGLSLCAFRIPEEHPMWSKVSARSYIERLLLPDQTIDNALWVVIDPGSMKVPYVNLHNISFGIRNEYE